jgi:hypothetical protein
MELETVSCNNCGAPLTITENVNFVTCGHCGTQLAVKRNESVTYTERLEHLESRTDDMANELKRLKMQQELNQLDDDWEAEKQNYMIRSKNGSTLPDEPQAVIGVVVSVIALVVLGIMALTIRDGVQFMCLPMLLFLGLTAWIGYDYYNKLSGYNAAMAAYQQRRDDIYQRYN